jgi:hypothetical protein
VVVVEEEAEVDGHQVVVVEVALLDAMEVLVVAGLHLMTVQEVLEIDMALQVVYLLQMVEAIIQNILVANFKI